ncbi:hypothetical protein [uncultured Desulfovibrio sp.]|uniref:hypothetical protein n=1 Tax=uncultured Desulfovibrio sp. TaxID=167968 RepID=UPI00261DDF10|nr:hypothetical protein [uncultured Desulfovibrio sp.]
MSGAPNPNARPALHAGNTGTGFHTANALQAAPLLKWKNFKTKRLQGEFMDIQLALVVLCVVVALFFIVRRFCHALRKGHCSCGRGNGGNGKNCCPGGCSGRKQQ